MFELLSMVGGGIFRLIPEILGLFKSKGDREHEIKMTQLQLEIDKNRSQLQIDLAHVNNDAIMAQADLQAVTEALKSQGTKTGVKWIDALSSSVRPVLTYWWCLGLYTAYKALIVVSAYQGGTPLSELAPLLLTEFDRGVIGSIFAFWFVDRALKKQ